MPVFTALRNKAQSTAAGFLTKTARNALGLNRAKGLRFPTPSLSPVTGGVTTTRDGAPILQYPLDLGTTGNSHFVAFFVKEITPTKITFDSDSEGLKRAREALKNHKKQIQDLVVKSKRGKLAEGEKPNGPRILELQKETPKLERELAKQKESLVGENSKKIKYGDKSGLSIRELQAASTKVVKTIALYFPPSINQKYELKYNDQEISRQAAFGAAVIQGFLAQGLTGDAIRDAVDPIFDGIKSVAARMGLTALDTIAPGAEALIALNRGKVLAPKMEVMFEGIGKRQFSYNFVFTPSSLDEADMIQNIITAFRTHAASNFAGASSFGFELTIPDVFEIVYYTNNNTENGYLHKIGNCALESVDVTYGGEKMTFHENNGSKGAPPTKVSMSLNFRELRTVTRDAIEKDGF
tara:strand:- start:390 stop:1619 length:1230 start_codon:yes stop_codon:yes gene_type:complete